MLNIIQKIKEDKKMQYLIIIVVGILLSIPLSQIQIRDTHDGALHLIRLIKTSQTLALGNFPPMVVPNIINGAGYAMNLFYPPLVTYIPLLIKMITPNYVMALKLFGGLCIILSGFTMYQFVYQVTKRRSMAFFAAIFYMIAPYKLANIYKRYAIGEFAALVFIPFVFLGLYNLFKQDGKKHYYIAIGAIGLMLTHTVSTFYIALFSIIYVLFCIKKLANKEILKKIGINLFFILLISSFFWLPLLEASMSAEYTILNDSLMRTTPQYTQDNTIEFYQLFTDKEEENGTTFIIGIPTLIFIIATIFTYKKVNSSYQDFYTIFLFFSFISLLLTLTIFPWRWMLNILCKLQYPWRMIGFLNFFMSMICGINLVILLNRWIKSDKIKVIVSGICIIIMVGYTIPVMMKFKTTKPFTLDSEYEKYITETPALSHMQINRDYLPTKALYLQNTYLKEREDKTYVLSGNVEIVKEEKDKLQDQLSIQNGEEGTVLELPYIFYPGYQVYLKIGETNYALETKESENGFIAITLPQEVLQGKIEVSYTGTLLTKITYIISAVGTFIGIIYIYQEKKKEKE
ncbi:MAG: 6-pyruvoyl-tetrahydropterin synthase-related protein [Clostridia bacterium]